MLADLVDRLVGLGRASEAPRWVTNELLPMKVFLVHRGEVQEYDAPPPWRTPTVLGLAALEAVLGDASMTPAPEVYFDATRVQAFLQRDERLSTVTLPLEQTEQFALVCSLRTPRQFSPREAVKFLRYELPGATAEPVVQSLRRIDFSRRSAGVSSVEHGKESFGRSVEAAVQQAESVPERFHVEVPVWNNAGLRSFRVRVECGLYLDLDAERVEIRVLPDEVERATATVLEQLGALLAERLAPHPVFMGRP